MQQNVQGHRFDTLLSNISDEVQHCKDLSFLDFREAIGDSSLNDIETSVTVIEAKLAEIKTFLDGEQDALHSLEQFVHSSSHAQSVLSNLQASSRSI